jgi:putative ABC transport system substrate-binding protein
MKRREFIGIVGGAIIALPLRAHAQQQGTKRVAIVLPASEGEQEYQIRLTAFLEALARLGWSNGRNLRLDVRWAGTDAGRYRAIATEVTSGSPDLIVVQANPLVAQFQSQTERIPIVFTAVSDPIAGGFVSNLARPGGNLTGFENFQPEIGGKWLQTLKEIAPSITRVGILLHPETAAHAAFRKVIETIASTLSVKIVPMGIHDGIEIERSLVTLVEQPDSGLIVLPHPILMQNRDLIIVLAARHRLPAIYPFRYFVTSGGLISYGIDPLEQWRGAADYVDRILKGEQPGNLPVRALDKYELVINLRTAKAIGVNVPASMLARAGVIE